MEAAALAEARAKLREQSILASAAQEEAARLRQRVREVEEALEQSEAARRTLKGQVVASVAGLQAQARRRKK